MSIDVKGTRAVLCSWSAFLLLFDCFKLYMLPPVLVATRNIFLLDFDNRCSGTTTQPQIYFIKSCQLLPSNITVLNNREVIKFKIK